MPKPADDGETKSFGQYRVSVTIIQARNLIPLQLNSSDPYIQLTLDNNTTQNTEKRMRTLSPVWNNRFDFAANVLPKRLQLACFDWNFMRNRGRMGEALLDLIPYWEEACPSVQWIPLTLEGKPAGEVQVQIGCTAMVSAPVMTPLEHTHLLELNILSAKNVSFGNGCSCEVEWGSCQFQTEQSATNDWNQTIYIWLDVVSHANSKIILTVKSESRKCYAHICVHEILARAASELNLDLQSVPRTDAELSKQNVALESLVIESSFGELRVDSVVRTTAMVERELTRELMQEFANEAGELDHFALSLMMQSAGIAMTEALVSLLDLRSRTVINQLQLLEFMQAPEVQNSGDLGKLLNYAKYKDAVGSLMTMAEATTEAGQKTTKHIVVRDLATGLLVYERIPAYIRAALQLMSSSKVTRLMTARSKNLMTNLSKRQGAKYDDPASVKAIPAFIKLHGLDMSEAERKVEEYLCFNDFFSRTLKPSARLIDAPKNPNRACSPADCRMIVFRDITESTKKWIKGKKFTLENLLGESGKMYVDLLQGGALVACRLAPQDYHRWHVPVKGVLGPTIPIDGKLYTVNPIAVNHKVSVFTENKRVLVPIFSSEFGVVMLIAVGAVMVGSICIDGKEGEEVEKGQPHGYFRFGGSTVLLLFEKDRIQFRQELLDNSRDNLETLIKCGQFLGTALPPKGVSPRGSKSQTPRAATLNNPLSPSSSPSSP